MFEGDWTLRKRKIIIYKPKRPMLLSSANVADAPQNDRSRNVAGMQGARLGRDAKPLDHWNVLPVELARENWAR